MKLHKIGMRTIKTALAVVVTLFISDLLKLESPFFAAIGAIMALEASVSDSFVSSRNRMFGTIIGSLVAIIIGLLLPNNVLTIGIGIIVVIYICNLFKWKDSIKISAIVLVSILLSFEDKNPVGYAFYRALDTLIGLGIGTLVNYFILPHNVGKKLNQSLKNNKLAIRNMLETITWKDASVDFDTFRKSFIKMEGDYAILKKEVRLHSGKNTESIDYKRVFIILENTYNHLRILTEIRHIATLDAKNQQLLEYYFRQKPPEQSKEVLTNEDIIYNYHLTKTLDNLIVLDELLMNI